MLRGKLRLNLCNKGGKKRVSNSAGIAQLVEQLICNQQVVGSSPTAGFVFSK